MQTTLPEFLHRKPQPTMKPMPPTREMMDALRRTPIETAFPPLDAEGVPQEERPRAKGSALPEKPAISTEANPLFKYTFKRPWFGEYTTKDCKFVLRVEHFPELMRLVNEFNKTRPDDEFPVSVSDIVSAALDFVLDHPLVLAGLEKPEQIREVMAGAVYRKAILRFIQPYGFLLSR